jgi:hypothetical protein
MLYPRVLHLVEARAAAISHEVHLRKVAGARMIRAPRLLRPRKRWLSIQIGAETTERGGFRTRLRDRPRRQPRFYMISTIQL